MDRIIELKSSTESIKRTMMMHEDIFKQQVKELHKLYHLQRKLMVDVKNEMSKIEDPRHKSMIYNMSTWHEPRREIEFNGVNVYGLGDDQQRETSGSCSGENSKTISIPIRGLNIEMEERSSTSNYEDEKMKNNNIHRCDEETNVELTLSIGPSNSKKRLKSHNKEKEISFSTSTKFEDCGDATSSVIFNKESAPQAYWFSQDLSLNRRS
ncbi:uncharacterized protein LOC107025649 [Solanum pennellii]|uniref:Uncharacterized protein LOC107025649 n=1 Tax=Solanum pennellii TaxID=28526 RepID=A0ABM1VDX0_SOLPN|nr:uncharacterized protein LOC107025649 [Solanum pennellii]